MTPFPRKGDTSSPCSAHAQRVWHPTAERHMIHWKVKLVHLAVVALVLGSAFAGYLAEPFGCAW